MQRTIRNAKNDIVGQLACRDFGLEQDDYLADRNLGEREGWKTHGMRICAPRCERLVQSIRAYPSGDLLANQPCSRESSIRDLLFEEQKKRLCFIYRSQTSSYLAVRPVGHPARCPVGPAMARINYPEADLA